MENNIIFAIFIFEAIHSLFMPQLSNLLVIFEHLYTYQTLLLCYGREYCSMFSETAGDILLSTRWMFNLFFKQTLHMLTDEYNALVSNIWASSSSCQEAGMKGLGKKAQFRFIFVTILRISICLHSSLVEWPFWRAARPPTEDFVEDSIYLHKHLQQNADRLVTCLATLT